MEPFSLAVVAGAVGVSAYVSSHAEKIVDFLENKLDSADLHTGARYVVDSDLKNSLQRPPEMDSQ